MAIGWHFFHEATHKIGSQDSDRPFSAEAYLRGSTGPLAERFRSLLPDPDSRELLDAEKLVASWAAELDVISATFAFDADQKAKAVELLQDRTSQARAWFSDPANHRKIAQYLADVDEIHSVRPASSRMAYEQELLTTRRKELEGTRKELLTPINEWSTSLRQDLTALAKPDQAQVAGSFNPPWTKVDWLNASVMYGMLAVGLCLMLGLFTPLAALGAAGYLAMFYLSMPPWPGLPPNPLAEGNYLYVNKNLIELIACLVLAATPSGLWIGLDAVLFGWIGRGRRARRAQPDDSTEPALAG